MITDSIEKYCKDYTKIENYELAVADKTQTWDCHYRLEFMPFSKKQCSHSYLIEQGMYFGVTADELIFLKRKDHLSLHQTDNKHALGNKSKTGQKCSDITKRKIADSAKGNTNVRGTHWYTNGLYNVRAKECPEGFRPGQVRG